MIEVLRPPSALAGELQLPADKSISHRSILFASLHEGRSEIRNFSSAADPASTVACMRALGVEIAREGGHVTVEGVGRGGLRAPGAPLDCGNSGTTMRLLGGIVAGAGLEAELDGDHSLRGRDMKRIADPLARMGLHMEARDGQYAPLKVRPHEGVRPMRFELPIPSAQLKSCVLLAGLFGEGETQVVETLPSRDHTERLLRLPVRYEGEGGGPGPGWEGPRRILASSLAQQVPEQSYRVPGDFSAAAFWLAAGAVHPEAEIHMPGVGLNPTRSAALQVLGDMGADIEAANSREEGAEPAGDLTVRSSQLQPIDIGPDLVPNLIDEIPVLCVAMCFADGVSTVRGARELRHKESDRLEAVAELLRAAGARFEEHEDGFTIYGDPGFRPQPARYRSFHDHRIAMSAAVLALRASGPSEVSGAECAAISYPRFWEDLEGLTN
ncbi:MAG: 3-phosphoshikimate 1-carboxyvinyltransferase [Balneolaceae bacterium]|nr:3-phosphoshikimate 1-carboxyvinyltransferase [Balneolaceae bacterium]